MGSACSSLKNHPQQTLRHNNNQLQHTLLVPKRHTATTVPPSRPVEAQRRGQGDVSDLNRDSAWLISQEEKQKCKGKLELEPSEEEDVCPTCLEEYMPENPKITLRCTHHFHLPCILEWEQRSQLCPLCNQVMVYC